MAVRVPLVYIAGRLKQLPAGEQIPFAAVAGLGSAARSNALAFATAAQGDKADAAVQPGDLGSAAQSDASAFATGAQGDKADSAVQPGDAISVLANDAGYTGDQSPAEIKTAYESNADTHAYTDADKTKLSYLAVSAATDLDAIRGQLAGLDTRYEPALKHNTAATDPTAADDSTAGYSIRSKWINAATGNSFVCLDASPSAAVWRDTTLTLDDLGSLATVDDAPADGVLRGRLNGAWAPIPGPRFLGFRASQNQTQSLDAGINTKILFQSVNFAYPSGWFDPDTSVFRPGAAGAGVWLVGASLNWSAGTASRKQLNLFKNDSLHSVLGRKYADNNSYVYTVGSALVMLDGDADYIALYGETDDNSDTLSALDDFSVGTYCWAMFVGSIA